jgi:hypothetical protein
MKIRVLVSFSVCFLFVIIRVNAQTDSSTVSQRAILSANDMLTAFRNADWDRYVSLSYPGVVKYYGGKTSYLKYANRARTQHSHSLHANQEQMRIVQLSKDKEEWQCVLGRSIVSYSNGKRECSISYFVGQSIDDGMSWKFFDVAYNSVESITYIMPDKFNALVVPVRRTVVAEEGFVQGK